MDDQELYSARPEWFRVESHVFVFAGFESGRTWALRLNNFPEHALYTLFVDAQVVGDLEDLPTGWGLDPLDEVPVLDRYRRSSFLESVAELGPYGTELDDPCDQDWCTCSVLTPAYVRELAPPKSF